MPHPLDGARLKVVRANEHLQSFNDEVARYINAEPYEIVSKIDPNIVSVQGVITAEPPPALACIVGDFVTNLRASLDYISWELVAAFCTTTLTDRDQRRISFPITMTKVDFTKTDGPKDRLMSLGVPALAISVIESVQPYNAGYDPIATLDLLVRTDKHRMLLLCAGFLDSFGEICIYRGDKLLVRTSGGSSFSRNYAADEPPRATNNLQVQVEQKPTVFVAFKDIATPPRCLHAKMLAGILKCVADIIPRFDSFF